MSKKYASTKDCSNATDSSNSTNVSNTVDSSAVDCGNCGNGCKGKKK